MAMRCKLWCGTLGVAALVVFLTLPATSQAQQPRYYSYGSYYSGSGYSSYYYPPSGYYSYPSATYSQSYGSYDYSPYRPSNIASFADQSPYGGYSWRPLPFREWNMLALPPQPGR
jgi:hypothetical protein